MMLSKRPIFANGQVILFREVPDRIGRHASVKTDILDDIGLARTWLGLGEYRVCF